MNATTKEIKREYKKQAMLIHPDKNPETEEQFKQLAAVYNILKDERTRAMYHRVLDEGLPEWRMPAFYDRQVQVVRHRAHRRDHYSFHTRHIYTVRNGLGTVPGTEVPCTQEREESQKEQES